MPLTATRSLVAATRAVHLGDPEKSQQLLRAARNAGKVRRELLRESPDRRDCFLVCYVDDVGFPLPLRLARGTRNLLFALAAGDTDNLAAASRVANSILQLLERPQPEGQYNLVYLYRTGGGGVFPMYDADPLDDAEEVANGFSVTQYGEADGRASASPD